MCFPPRDDDADNSAWPEPEREETAAMTAKAYAAEQLAYEGEEYLKRRTIARDIQTRLNVAVARRDTKLVITLMQQLAKVTGSALPEAYKR